MLKNITSCDFIYIKEGQIQGYFFANKGLDLQNIIHEMALKIILKEF